MAPLRIAVIGLGKIARDQHLPAIAASDEFHLTATADPRAPGLPEVRHFPDLAALLADGPEIDAVALCMPPHCRYEIAAAALAQGLHVLLEKPPGATFGEAEQLRALADKAGCTLFAAWHSRFASGIEPARRWLAPRKITRVVATWHEDVRVWHPGQAWIWAAGGFGVFDPGINALSIVTRVLPHPLRLTAAKLFTPDNRQAPIAANLVFSDTMNTEVVLDLDWTKQGAPRWDIEVETDLGLLKLGAGGAKLTLPAGECLEEAGEYPALYHHFAQLAAAGACDADMTPLMHVADAFLIAERHTAETFDD